MPQTVISLAPVFDSVEGLANECGKHMRRVEVEVIVGTVDICRHRREVTGTVLTVIAPAHLNTGDLRKSVRTVCWFKRTSEQRRLRDWLRSKPRIDTGRAQNRRRLTSDLRADSMMLD